MKIRKLKKDDIAVEIDEFGDEFFIIMEGCVSVLIPMMSEFKIKAYPISKIKMHLKSLV